MKNIKVLCDKTLSLTTQSKLGNLRYNTHLLALADQTKTQGLAHGRAGQCTSLYIAPLFGSALESSLIRCSIKEDSLL